MIRGVLNYIFYLFKKDKAFYFKLIGVLGFLPGNISLYKTAFTHKSAAYSTVEGGRIDNERLEYLGDALLGAIAAEHPTRRQPGFQAWPALLLVRER